MNGLPPRPGAKKRAAARNKSGLGRSLINQKKNNKKNPNVSERYSVDDDGAQLVDKLRSVTQERPLDEFLSTAELAGTDFTTERSQAIKIISTNADQTSALTDTRPSRETLAELARIHDQNRKRLTVPRRPKWNKEMTAYELDRIEKDSFLEWRRGLAQMQDEEELLLTPFERNVEVWRQLWRVVERSDLVVQIVDARNPLFFRSPDLATYVEELDDGKKRNNMLLINKADLMLESQRKEWAKYFKNQGIAYAFFSAKIASGEAQEMVDRSVESDGLDAEDTRIITVEQLEELFSKNSPKKEASEDDRYKGLQIGLVGYPNVGKSSTINALIGAKKVSVSATPGKTKHFQTIVLSPEMTLCDCPGLVFPNFALTNGELVCNGVLPIDQLREWHTSAALITERIPKFFLEALYGISIMMKPLEEGGTGVPTSEEFLRAYARARGYMRGGGQGAPDEGRAARIILKDYVNAKLLYCFPPPTYEDDAHAFNEQLYTIHGLPESRQKQILSALVKQRAEELSHHENDLQGSNLKIDEIDLAVEIEKLSFSQHFVQPDKVKSKKSVANEFSDAATLDNDFFGSGGYGANIAQPFHLAGGVKNNGKKHFKGNKKGKK